jgi:hypothetical protein
MKQFIAVQQSDVSEIQKWNITFRKLNVSFLGYEGWKTLHIESVPHYFLSLCAVVFEGYLNPTEEVPAKIYTWDANRLGSQNIVPLFCIF